MDYRKTPFGDSSLDIEDRLDWLINELTIEEKLRLISSGSDGIERLGIPACFLGGEAAHGVEGRNDQNKLGDPDVTTSFPQPIGMSASWDPALMKEAGGVTGREARAVYKRHPGRGLSRWAPTIDIERDPRWGRNEEAYGEDPVQIGAMASAYIQGMQGDDPRYIQIASTLKHFYANNNEIGRGWRNASITPRDKYEMYLEPFRRAIEDGGAAGVMTAYNRINGIQGLFNPEVQDILKNEFGLMHAVSDGGAMSLSTTFAHSSGSNAESVRKALRAGLDAFAEGPMVVNPAVQEAYELGYIDESDLDRAIRNTYRIRLKLGIFDEEGACPYDSITEEELCSSHNRDICRQLTDESLVLLKNDGILPLDRGATAENPGEGTEAKSIENGRASAAAEGAGEGRDSVVADKKETSGIALIGPVADKWYQDWYGGCPPERISLLEGLNSLLDSSDDDSSEPSGRGIPALNDEIDSQSGASIIFTDACDHVKLRVGDKYLATDGEGRVGLSDAAETFVMEDWGEGSYTFRSLATGKYMITRLEEQATEGIAAADAAGEAGAYVAGRVYADAEQIFSWFDLEVFRFSGDNLRDRFGNPVCVDEDGRLFSLKTSYLRGNPRMSLASEESDFAANANFIRIKIEKVRDGIGEAVKKAKEAQTVILALGHNPMVNAKEEIDRETIEMIPYQQKLFDAVYEANPDVVVVLMSDYPFAINEIEQKARAILWSATGSQCMGESIAAALTGEAAPAGRLTQTWYRSDKDLPDIYDYDIIRGHRTYRYFEGEVLYPFGHGLTYTSFEYSDLTVTLTSHPTTKESPGTVLSDLSSSNTDAQPRLTTALGTHMTDALPSSGTSVYETIKKDRRYLHIEIKVTNTGKTASDEVVQIYAAAPRTRVPRPIRQLIGFERIRDVKPAESRHLKLDIPFRELAYYDVISEQLIIEAGTYEISAGASSSDIRITEKINIEETGSVAEDISPKCRNLRDTAKRIRADHFDEMSGGELIEGQFGYTALATVASDPDMDPCIPEEKRSLSVTYRDCGIPFDSVLCIHCYAPQKARVEVYVDDVCAGTLEFDTMSYEKIPSEQRNFLPRESNDLVRRMNSFVPRWTNVYISLEFRACDDAHSIRIDALGSIKFDWIRITE